MAEQAIFISYRRSDTMDVCGRIYDKLAAAFGSDAIFRDVDSNIPLGEDFRKHIAKTLQQCRVALILIGPGWMNARDRLDDPDDPVRLEIEEGNKNPHVQVIPVLVNGAQMPETGALPEAMRSMTRLNAPAVRRDPDFHKDMEDLIAKLKEGALTGFVKIEAPLLGADAAIAAWREVEPTLSVEDLRRFADSFPSTAVGLEARRQADALARLSTARSIDDFLARWPSHPARPALLARRDHMKAAEERNAASIALRNAVNKAEWKYAEISKRCHDLSSGNDYWKSVRREWSRGITEVRDLASLSKANARDFHSAEEVDAAFETIIGRFVVERDKADNAVRSLESDRFWLRLNIAIVIGIVALFWYFKR